MMKRTIKNQGATLLMGAHSEDPGIHALDASKKLADNLRDASCFDEVQKGEKTFPLEVEA